MYKINDVIVYGKHGVCRIDGIGALSMGSADKEYYTLRPIYQQDAVVYVPVDNDKIVMRYVISKPEAENIINDIPKMEFIVVANERERENMYKEILKNCDCREIVRMIKTIHQRKITRLQDGKKSTAIDEKYFRMAEEKLYGELAFALDIEKEKVYPYILKYIQS